MLTLVGDEIIEIRPNQVIKSRRKIDSPYMVLITAPKPRQPKKPKDDINGVPKTKA